MTTEVIILAQGTQQRLGMRHGYKQLLPLPHCEGVAIIGRTIRQLMILLGHNAHDSVVKVITWPEVASRIGGRPPTFSANARALITLECATLPEPGNSALKGIARYLETRGDQHGHRHTIVLLGDVVYSWSCLEAIWRMAEAYGFVGTLDLSESGGELWGVAWSRAHEGAVIADLRDALLRHPPFEDEYQPGQLRRWIMGWRRGSLQDRIAKLWQAGIYHGVNDYTMDVDLPVHIPLLEEASESAAEDDALHGLSWDPSLLAYTVQRTTDE